MTPAERDQLVDAVLARNRVRLVNACWGRERALSRARVGRLVDETFLLLDQRPQLVASLGREDAIDWAVDHVAIENELTGFLPAWLLALVLKVIVTIVIDWWLMQSRPVACR